MSGRRHRVASSLSDELTSEDAKRFKRLATEALRKLRLTKEQFAEAMGVDPRTIFRYLSLTYSLNDEQAGAVFQALARLDDRGEVPVLEEMMAIHSPRMHAVLVAAFEELRRWEAQTPEQQICAGHKINRFVLSASLAQRLVSEGLISSRRKNDVARSIFNALEQSGIECSLTLAQQRRVAGENR